MGEGAVLASLVDLEEPDDGRQQDDGRLDEEVSLLLYPCTVQVEHDGVGGFVGIGDVRHEGGIDGITAMRLVRVVEVDDEELGLHLIGIEVPQEMVVGDLREVWELVMRWILIVCSDLGRNRVGFLSMIKLPRAKSSYPFGTI